MTNCEQSVQTGPACAVVPKGPCWGYFYSDEATSIVIGAEQQMRFAVPLGVYRQEGLRFLPEESAVEVLEGGLYEVAYMLYASFCPRDIAVCDATLCCAASGRTIRQSAVNATYFRHKPLRCTHLFWCELAAGDVLGLWMMPQYAGRLNLGDNYLGVNSYLRLRRLGEAE